MKVIFLDVDGVLNSAKDDFSYILESDSHLKLLKYIVDSTHAKIVISSSWRLFGMDILTKRLKDFSMEVYSITHNLEMKFDSG